MLGFALGLLASNAAEWAVHKYVLHGLGKKKGTFWAFHFHEHHKSVRKNGGRDAMYERPFWEAPSKSKEAFGLMATAAISLPLLPVSPGFVAASWLHSGAYYAIHKKAHLDPEWARKWVPWHVDHHMGPDQDKNWCVTYPLFDWIMRSREPWVGTPAEAESRARVAARAAAPATAQARTAAA
jgi:hypothetical protein